uniref:Uncharacterized protein n=1 Tax=Schistosoma curassoni TaxID=6186 RepID=A0A183L605_9TREM
MLLNIFSSDDELPRVVFSKEFQRKFSAPLLTE